MTTIFKAIDSATAESKTEEDWNAFMYISDFMAQVKSHENMKAIIKHILSRYRSSGSTNTKKHLLTVIDVCLNNSGAQFREEFCRRKVLMKLNEAVNNEPKNSPQMRKFEELKVKWKKDFGKDSTCEHLLSLCNGTLSSSSSQSHGQSAGGASSKEEQDLAAAIANSLKDVKQTLVDDKTANTTSRGSSLYPDAGMAAASSNYRQVKAMYDFDAAEENELAFSAGEILTVLNDNEDHWWEVRNGKGKFGFIPAHFVTSDLNYELPHTNSQGQLKTSKKGVSFGAEDNPSDEINPDNVKIDKDKIERCLTLLEEADPTGERPDPEDLPKLEQECTLFMGPMLDRELDKIDTLHSRQSEVQQNVLDAMRLYHQLMENAAAASSMYRPPAPPATQHHPSMQSQAHMQYGHAQQMYQHQQPQHMLSQPQQHQQMPPMGHPSHQAPNQSNNNNGAAVMQDLSEAFHGSSISAPMAQNFPAQQQHHQQLMQDHHQQPPYAVYAQQPMLPSQQQQPPANTAS